MKKKIKDITFFDVNEECLKYKDCEKCPLCVPYELAGRLCIISLLHHTYTVEWEDYLEIEVEI